MLEKRANIDRRDHIQEPLRVHLGISITGALIRVIYTTAKGN